MRVFHPILLLLHVLYFTGIFRLSNADEAFSISHRKAKPKCYKGYGCYSLEYPFYMPPERSVPVPDDPAKLNVSVDYYSRQQTEPINIPLYGNISLKNADFNASRPLTIFIISAFGKYLTWHLELKDAFLHRMDANVFFVNTSTTCNENKIHRSVSNIRVAAVLLARFIKYLQVHYKLQPHLRVWIIGYDIGAHMAGYTGKRVPLARVTGLDPTQIFFEGYPSLVRLDRSDALFVDVIHTDAFPTIPNLGNGMINPIGHVDIYVNSGRRQPGCRYLGVENFWPYNDISVLKSDLVTFFLDVVKHVVAVLVAVMLCNHNRAYKYFIHSIKNMDCVIWGHPINLELLSQGASNGESGGNLILVNAIRELCTVETCVPMGMHTSISKLRGIFIATTTGVAPWCSKVDQNVPTSERGSYDHFMNMLLGLAGL